MARQPSWEPVWQGHGEAQAQIVAGGLDSRGIRARVQGARQVSGFPHAFQGNTWAVFVPTTNAAHARALLREQGEGDGVVSGGALGAGEVASTLKFVALAIAGCLLLLLVAMLQRGV